MVHVDNRHNSTTNIILTFDNPILSKLTTMYTIAQSQVNPYDYTWYNYSELEIIIRDQFQKGDNPCVALCEFVSFIRTNYNISTIQDVRVIDDILILIGVK